MTTPMKTEKTFDCVEFKRRVQLQIYEQIQDMNHGQEQAYFRDHAEQGPLGDWWKRVKAAQQAGK